MNLKDFWIGDSVRIISQDLIGKFAGEDNMGNAKVDYNGELIQVLIEDLELYTEPEPVIEQVDIEPEPVKGFQTLQKQKLISHVIDLHYNVLAPDRFRINPHENILEFQVQKCKEFIEFNLQRRVNYIQIIHGKGQGILKAEVEKLLNGFDRVRFSNSTPDGGGLEVFLK